MYISIYLYIHIKLIHVIYKGSETFIGGKPLLTLNTIVASGILFVRTIFIEFFYLGTKATFEKCQS